MGFAGWLWFQVWVAESQRLISRGLFEHQNNNSPSFRDEPFLQEKMAEKDKMRTIILATVVMLRDIRNSLQVVVPVVSLLDLLSNLLIVDLHYLR